MNLKQKDIKFRPVLLGATLVLLISSVSKTIYPARDPEKIIGPDICGICHKSEVVAWRETTHFKNNELHRRPEAKQIASKLRIRRIKRESLCQTCHFTTQAKGRRPRAIAGVSCESCHGAAADWIHIHSDYGGGQATRETETAEHKKMRMGQTAKTGMIRPDQPYLIAENCYQCHTVPQEELVNKTGHPAGSAFELVAWLGGEVRHNFFMCDGKENREAPGDLDEANHKRVLYVVGRMLDLEYGLRGLAKATAAGTYTEAMKQRTMNAMEKLKEIQGKSQAVAPIVGEMLDETGKVKLAPNNAAELTAAAEKVKAIAQQFVAKHDGSRLADLDVLIPGKDQYKGKVYGQ
ncbi:MAG: multiheme c-type cytochrome [Candidatus Poribacteria bacterium]|nr:multiheme c-type cytochrome [Candidatus Poribacteria bacterium]